MEVYRNATKDRTIFYPVRDIEINNNVRSPKESTGEILASPEYPTEQCTKRRTYTGRNK